MTTGTEFYDFRILGQTVKVPGQSYSVSALRWATLELRRKYPWHSSGLVSLPLKKFASELSPEESAKYHEARWTVFRAIDGRWRTMERFSRNCTDHRLLMGEINNSVSEATLSEVLFTAQEWLDANGSKLFLCLCPGFVDGVNEITVRSFSYALAISYQIGVSVTWEFDQGVLFDRINTRDCVFPYTIGFDHFAEAVDWALYAHRPVDAWDHYISKRHDMYDREKENAALSYTDPTKLAIRNHPTEPWRRTLVNPGKVLARYHDANFVKDMVSTFNGTDVELCWAEEAADIVHVYRNGPDSCMAKPLSLYDSHVHPVSVYESPDFKLAYLKRGGEIVARTLVGERSAGQRKYVRIYGTVDRYRTVLHNLLAKEDIEKGNDGFFNGLRLQRIEGDGYLVVPYWDGDLGFEDDGEYLVLSYDGDIGSGSTEGVWNFPKPVKVTVRSIGGEVITVDRVTYDEDEENWHREDELDPNVSHCVDSSSVNVVTRWAPLFYRIHYSTTSQYWADNAEDIHFCEKIDEYYQGDEPIFIETLGQYWMPEVVAHYGNPDEDPDNAELLAEKRLQRGFQIAAASGQLDLSTVSNDFLPVEIAA